MFNRSSKNHASSEANGKDPRIAASLKQLRALEFQARGFSFLPSQPASSILTGRRRSKLRGRGLNFEELRHYRPGDDIRSLDWKVTNRTGKPHVRVYSEERDRSVLLIVDQRISMFFGSERAMKSVVAAEVAALAAWRVLSAGDRIGAIVFDDERSHSFTERRSRDQVLSILRQLERSNAALSAGCVSNASQLNEALALAGRRLPHDGLVLYIGDGHGFDERSERLVKRIAQHNDFVAMNIFDAAERELPALDSFVVSDGRMQISVDARGKDVAARYQGLYAQDMGRMRQVLKRYGVPVVPVNTTDEPVRQLLRALGGAPR